MSDLSAVSTADLLAAAGPSPQTFAAQYAPAAQAAAAQIGVDPKLLLGQWGHETGWGKSIIPGTNNLGNIKDPSGKGPKAIDNATGSNDSYQAFNSPEDFGNAYANLVKTNYPGVVGAGSDVGKFTKGLAGYAQDPSYAGHVAAAVKSVPDLSQQTATQPTSDLSQMSTADLMAAAGIKPPPSQQSTSSPLPLGGFLTGVGDFAKGATRAIVHGMSGAANYIAPNSQFAKDAAASLPQIDATMQGQNAQYAAARAAQGQTGTDWARMAGQVAPSLALPMTGGGIGAGLISGAAGGAIQGAVNTGPGQSYGQNMALGGGVGALAGGAAGALGSAIGGAQLSPDAQRLVDMGVTPTPGQAMGGTLGSMEEKIGKTIPGLGEQVRNAQNAATAQFNRGMYQNALAPLGAQLPNDIAAGSGGIQHVNDTIGNAYQQLESQARFQPRGQFLSDLGQIRTSLAQNSPASLPQFDNIVDKQIAAKLQGGVMNGAQWGDTRSSISTFARNQRLGNATPDNRMLADHLDDLNQAINTQVVRNSPPGIQPALQNANAAWARYKQLETAAGSTGASNNGNVFTPAQYTAAIRKGSTASQKSTNSGLNADVAASAQNVLGNRIPNSGTPERAAAIGVPAAIFGLATQGHPYAAASLAGGIGAGMAAYGTQAGRQAMLAALFSRPQLMRNLGPVLGGMAPQAVAAATNSLKTNPGQQGD